MEIVVNLLMVLVAAAMIGYPFLGKGQGADNFLATEKNQVDTREVIFSALGEIEFDYQMNKLNAEDYQELKAGYQRQALTVLETEDQALDGYAEQILARASKVQQKGGQPVEEEADE